MSSVIDKDLLSQVQIEDLVDELVELGGFLINKLDDALFVAYCELDWMEGPDEDEVIH